MSVTIKEVLTKKDLKRFIRFPNDLYKDCPLWIPPLNADEYATLDRKRNPAFDHCESVYFLAFRGEKIVGRIAGIINHHANNDWDEKTVRFGWFDFIDDPEVSGKLLDAVGNWGRENRMEIIHGPWGFSDMDKEGLLVEGFDRLHSISTLYNYPYYGEHLEKHGFVKECDWVQFFLDLPTEVPPKIAEYDRIVREKFGLTVITPRKLKDIRKRAAEMFDVLNQAYVSLHEFTRLTKKQIRLYIAQYVPFVNKDLICAVVDKDDRVIGFAITMPTMSRAFQKARGRLFPFGFYHILKSLHRFDTIECYLIGVVPEYRNKGVTALIFNYLHTNYVKHGVKVVISHPQLENNLPVQKTFDYYEHRNFARRRCYFSHLSNQSK